MVWVGDNKSLVINTTVEAKMEMKAAWKRNLPISIEQIEEAKVMRPGRFITFDTDRLAVYKLLPLDDLSCNQ